MSAAEAATSQRAARAEKKRRRSPAQRKTDYIDRQVERALEEADEGPTSYPATYMEPSGYTAYGERVAESAGAEAEADWDRAVVLWNAIGGEDGDEKYASVLDVCGEDLTEEMIGMEIELGVVG